MLKKEFLTLTFLKFLLVGGTAALVSIIARFLLSLTMAYTLSIILAHMLGMVVAFTLNRRFVFKDSQRKTHQQIYDFTLVNLYALLQTLLLSLLLARWLLPALGLTDLQLGETVAHICAVGFTAFTSYLGHKYLTFR